MSSLKRHTWAKAVKHLNDHYDLKMPYITLYGWSVLELNTRVSVAMQEGFVPVGGVSTLTLKVNCSDEDGSLKIHTERLDFTLDGILFQAMVNPENIEYTGEEDV